MISPRAKNDPVIQYVNPYIELNVGLWMLFAGATGFLALRIWCKISRGYGLWWDDWILVVSWGLLLANDSLMVHEYATGYILKDTTEKWDDRMHILINITSCLTLILQSITKTAFGITLLRLSNNWQKWILWFCIVTMNLYMVVKAIFQWAKICGKASTDDDSYRLDFCIGSDFRDDFKEGGNVYNVIMDFIFAAFPWLITQGLTIRRPERIALCLTMSLGMIVAIVAAVRIGWKDDGNSRDAYYIWRNAMSQIWYSSEITGTIMVQCIPVLRPFIKEVSSTLRSKATAATNTRSMARRSKAEAKQMPSDQESNRSTQYLEKELPPPPFNDAASRSSGISDIWPLMGTDLDVNGRDKRKSSDVETGELDQQQGLSPPPRRP
ncbi:hypothetical protein GQ53DRAFT_712195 [Thozetella sp. PMI_491]|nr:hypothetical protein GQ53DRAFT_712195 [Thozetella sp. PMI_491]